jgi:hypothetical protein
MTIGEILASLVRVDVALLLAVLYAVFRGGRWSQSMLSGFTTMQTGFSSLSDAFAEHTEVEIQRFDRIADQMSTLRELHRVSDEELLRIKKLCQAKSDGG